MKAMLLAAGLGKRLRPLTDQLPKPLIEAGGKSLIEHHLVRLREAGVMEVVINLHHLAEQLTEKLGDGSEFGLNITYAFEPALLETGGGIKNALPLLGDGPFIVCSADTYLDFDLRKLPEQLPEGVLGLLVMTSNPRHHPEGDYAIDQAGVLQHAGERLTYTGTSVLHPELVKNEPQLAFMLRQVFDPAVSSGRLLGARHDGYWCDVGTESRLAELREKLHEDLQKKRGEKIEDLGPG